MRDMAPGMEMVRFTNSGTESTMHAMRLARGFTGRPNILKFEGHFHGNHDQVLLNVSPPFRTNGEEIVPFPVGRGIPPAHYSAMVLGPWNDVDALARIIDEHKDDLADQENARYMGVEAPSPDATQQVLWTALGIVLFIAVLVFLHDYRLLARYSYTLGLIGLVALAIPALLPSRFSEVNGAKLWIKIGTFSIQPGEFAKLALVSFFAYYLVRKREVLSLASHRFLGIDFPRGLTTARTRPFGSPGRPPRSSAPVR